MLFNFWSPEAKPVRKQETKRFRVEELSRRILLSGVSGGDIPLPPLPWPPPPAENGG